MTLHDLNLPQNELDAVREASAVLKARHPVVRILLFGSKARGDDRPESDIDLLVLTSRKLSWAERKAICGDIYELQLRYDVLLSPLVVSEVQWDSGVYQVLPIYHEVLEQGIAV